MADLLGLEDTRFIIVVSIDIIDNKGVYVIVTCISIPRVQPEGDVWFSTINPW